jgi:WD40 repeat protein
VFYSERLRLGFKRLPGQLYLTRTSVTRKKSVQHWPQIFTASSDGFVGQFNVKKSVFVGKFKCEEGTKSNPVHSVCVHPSDNSVITGMVAKITWWDLDTKSPLKTFSGAHLGPVTIVTAVTVDAERCLLVSGGSSEQDHTLAVWNLGLESKDIKAEEETAVARYGNGKSCPQKQ